MMYTQVLVLTASCHLVSQRKITRSSSQILCILEEALYVMKGKKYYSTDVVLIAERRNTEM